MNERTEFALSAHRELMGWLCSSPPYDLAVPVSLLLRHGDDWDRGSLHMDLANGLETGSPYIHLHCSDLALSLGAGSPRKKGISPVGESVLLQRALPRRRAHYGLFRFIIWNFSVWSRGRGPAAAETRRRFRSRGSHMDLADGLETGSPYLHLHSSDLALSRGSPRCGPSPFWERASCCSTRCRGNACIVTFSGL